VRRALFLLKSPPYGTLRVTEGYRAALGVAASGIPTHVVLVGDGVYAALRGQDPTGIDQVCVAELLEGLVTEGVDVFLLGPSARERGLDTGSLLPFLHLTAEAFADLVHACETVLTF